MARWNPVLAVEESFPKDVLRTFLVAVFDAFEAAWRDSNATFGGNGRERIGAFESPQAKWMYPYARKNFVDVAIGQAASRAGLFTKTGWNDAENCPHTLVISGSTVLTPHFVRTPGEVVRHAQYRDGYSANPQRVLNFFASEDEGEMLTPTLDKPTYFWLIYGESSKPQYPAFVDVVHPLKDCTGYDGRIKLCPMFQTFINERIGKVMDAEAIPDMDLKLKPRAKEA